MQLKKTKKTLLQKAVRQIFMKSLKFQKKRKVCLHKALMITRKKTKTLMFTLMMTRKKTKAPMFTLMIPGKKTKALIFICQALYLWGINRENEREMKTTLAFWSALRRSSVYTMNSLTRGQDCFIILEIVVLKYIFVYSTFVYRCETANFSFSFL